MYSLCLILFFPAASYNSICWSIIIFAVCRGFSLLPCIYFIFLHWHSVLNNCNVCFWIRVFSLRHTRNKMGTQATNILFTGVEVAKTHLKFCLIYSDCMWHPEIDEQQFADRPKSRHWRRGWLRLNEKLTWPAREAPPVQCSPRLVVVVYDSPSLRIITYILCAVISLHVQCSSW